MQVNSKTDVKPREQQIYFKSEDRFDNIIPRQTDNDDLNSQPAPRLISTSTFEQGQDERSRRKSLKLAQNKKPVPVVNLSTGESAITNASRTNMQGTPPMHRGTQASNASTNRRPSNIANNRKSFARSSQRLVENTYKTILLGDSGVGKTSLFLRITKDIWQEQVDPTLQMDIGRKHLRVMSRGNQGLRRKESSFFMDQTGSQIQESTFREDGSTAPTGTYQQYSPSSPLPFKLSTNNYGMLNTQTANTSQMNITSVSKEEHQVAEYFDDEQGILDIDQEVCLQIWDTPGQETFRSLVKIYYRKVQAVVLMVSLENSHDQERMKKQLSNLDYWMEELSMSIDPTQDGDGGPAFILLGNKADLINDDVAQQQKADQMISDWCQTQKERRGFNIEYYKCSTKTGAGVDHAF